MKITINGEVVEFSGDFELLLLDERALPADMESAVEMIDRHREFARKMLSENQELSAENRRLSRENSSAEKELEAQIIRADSLQSALSKSFVRRRSRRRAKPQNRTEGRRAFVRGSLIFK